MAETWANRTTIGGSPVPAMARLVLVHTPALDLASEVFVTDGRAR